MIIFICKLSFLFYSYKWEKYKNIIEANDEEGSFHGFSYLERQEFYERAKKACAIVATNEREKYANIILKLGVVEGE